MSRAWSIDEIVGVAAQGLRAAARARDAEQAVLGIDGLDEVALQAELTRDFRERGWGVLRERPYPSPNTRGSSARDSERERCDLVLTPDPDRPLADPMGAERERVRAEAELAGTLFEGRPLEPSSGSEPLAPLRPEDAFWLEVKTVGQFAYVDGVPGPNARYGSLLVGGIREDLRKLGRDPRIRFGGVLMVLFAAEEQEARHDLAEAVSRVADLGVTVTEPVSRAVAIADRAGNGVCLVSLIRRRSG